ncbi:hypothetical protein B0T14DRAFT_591643 [Immersiella caudata]|uniref:Uncharacterized protein n=1 Tax=Immersiella caudata TaxID=314043 RepID=A0AA39WE27_9PEZI|nr:hypothetical protein B0T14DRAFT_591643 [Immersiella caudata]
MDSVNTSDDKTLSERILVSAEAMQQWKAMEPIANELASLVNEYREVIDGIGTVFSFVGFFWNIYSGMEKAKGEAAKQQALVKQVTDAAVQIMITRATADVKNHIDEKEVKEVIDDVNAVLEGFRYDVLPHLKSGFPATGVDAIKLDSRIEKARDAIVALYRLIDDRARVGNGAAVILLYRNLQALVQCKLAMDKWLYGNTEAVIDEAYREITRLSQATGTVTRGLELMSDLSFSQGIVRFQTSGRSRGPQLTQYSYLYKGQAQPVRGSDKAPVVDAFIEARKAARGNAVPEEVKEWNSQVAKMWLRVNNQKLMKRPKLPGLRG